jgi:hypothetical protein
MDCLLQISSRVTLVENNMQLQRREQIGHINRRVKRPTSVLQLPTVGE